MRPLWTIAKMTWTELLRDRIVVVLAFCALFLLVLASFLGSLTLDEQVRLLVHVGFAGFELTLVGLAIFLGSWTLQKELDRQTCLLVLSRPVSRTQFLLGKWAGALLLISLFWFCLGILHLVLLNFGFPTGRYFAVHFTLWLEAAFVLSMAFFFATWLRPLLAVAFSVTLWLGGHWKEDLAFFAKRGGPTFKQFAEVADWALPPLNRLDLRTVFFLQNGDFTTLQWPVLHLFFWSALFLFLAQLIWQRRDLV